MDHSAFSESPDRRSVAASLLLPGLLAAAFIFGACGSGGGGGSSLVPGSGGSNPRLATVEYGLLADIYGLDSEGFTELYREDVMVGPDIQDERTALASVPNNQITYDFLSADPDNLQPRLLITRELGSSEFAAAFDALDDKLRVVSPGFFGSGQAQSLVPRNAALRLTFTHDLGITEEFFVERSTTGQVTGLKNTQAIQLLEITGNPNNPNTIGSFVQISTRLLPRGNQVIVDPVLLGSEGLQYQTRNNASGMPESPNQIGANMRLALALEGPMALPGLRADRVGQLNGMNNSGLQSVIRDFRSGNRNDNTPDVAKGYLRDPLPPRIVGQIVTYLEKVDDYNSTSQVVTLFKNGVSHELDVGDSIQLMIDNTGVPAAVTEITSEPSDDEGQPAIQHVRCIVRKQFRPGPGGKQIDILQDWDPSDPTRSNQFWQVNGSIPSYPTSVAAREPWLVQYAPLGVVITEFTAGDTSAGTTRDDPRFFVTFSPAPLPNSNGDPSPPNENVSPSAAAIIRFTKPVDLATVKPLDTFFFATRNLLDPVEEQNFITGLTIDPATFVRAKYWTPHLVGATRIDEDGSQTDLRLQPRLGFYLDDAMRADEGKPLAGKAFTYFMHVLGGPEGIKDLSGNPVDFQAQVAGALDYLVIEFSLDTRENTQTGRPLHENNLAVTVARRFASPDEDEQPSYYQQSEVQTPTGAVNPKAFNLQDVFGAVVHLSDGGLSARPTARVRQIVDDLNQQSPPPQNSFLRFCPFNIGSEEQVPAAAAGTKFGSPLQNPLNPFGCRLQTLWREIDTSLSRTDPLDFNLDVEQMFWAPYSALPIVFDEFDQMSLFLSHSEWRPENCVGAFGALPTLPNSGLVTTFDDNFAHNFAATGERETAPGGHPAYMDQAMTILPSLAVTEPNGVNRYLQLPEFDKPYFVWRDETSPLQGARSGIGRDTRLGGNSFIPFIISPFLTGRGRYVTEKNGNLQFNTGAWDSRDNFMISKTGQRDTFSGGLVGAVALPLLADFWTYPDSSVLPAANPFRASGANGWQVALAVQSSWKPNYRAYSAGGLVQQAPQLVDPTSQEWVKAGGGFTPNGGRTRSADNTVFWIMADFVKRQSVLTAGFVEILDPHRMPMPATDPRLGPYYSKVMPANVKPNYLFEFDPPLSQLPGGTSLIAEFRGAGLVDRLGNGGSATGMPWAAAINNYSPTSNQEAPDDVNFPLDPLKAGDAGIRKYDDRMLSGNPRNTWTHYYNRNVTDYTLDPNDLADDTYTNQYSGPNENFLTSDVKYINWRFVFENNVEANPPVTPVIDTFILTYRLEKQS